MPIADEIIIAIRAEVDKALADMKKTEKAVTETEKSTKKLSATFAQLRDFMQGPVAAAEKVANGFKKVYAAGKELYDAYGKDELATIRLNAALQNNSSLTYTASARFEELASSLQKVSIFGDDEIKTLISQLAAMGRTEEQINDIVKASANFASATGRNLVDTGLQINKTFSGLAGELGEANGGIRALSQEQLKNGDAVKILNKQYEGFTEKVGKGATGSATQLKNATTDLKESIGGLIALDVKKFTNAFADSISKLADAAQEELNYRKVLAGEETDINKIEKALKTLNDKKDDQKDSTLGVNLALVEEEKILVRLAAAAGGRLRAAQEAAGKERERAQAASDAAEAERKRAEEEKKAFEEGLAYRDYIIEKDGEITGSRYQAAYDAYIKSLNEGTKAVGETAEATEEAVDYTEALVAGFSDLVGLDFDGLVSAIVDFDSAEADAVTTAERLRDALGDAFNVAGATFGAINDLQANQHDAELQRIQDEIDARKEAGEDTTDLEQELSDKKNKYAKDEFESKKATAIAEALVNGAVAFTKALPNVVLAGIVAGLTSVQVAAIASQQYVPMAQGGITQGPTRALIGEAGPEAVIPLRDIGKGIGANGGITIVQNVQGSIWRERELGNLALGAVANAGRGF